MRIVEPEDVEVESGAVSRISSGLAIEFTYKGREQQAARRPHQQRPRRAQARARPDPVPARVLRREPHHRLQPGPGVREHAGHPAVRRGRAAAAARPARSTRARSIPAPGFSAPGFGTPAPATSRAAATASRRRPRRRSRRRPHRSTGPSRRCSCSAPSSLSPLFGMGSTKLADNVLAPVSTSCPTGQDKPPPARLDVIATKRTRQLSAPTAAARRGRGRDRRPRVVGGARRRAHLDELGPPSATPGSSTACARCGSAAPPSSSNERILLVLAGIVAPLGLVLVLLGYHGASQTPYVFEQVSYLISGGLLGLALVFLGLVLLLRPLAHAAGEGAPGAVRGDARGAAAPAGRGGAPARRRWPWRRPRQRPPPASRGARGDGAGAPWPTCPSAWWWRASRACGG